MYTYMYVYTHVCMCVCVCIYIYICIYIYFFFYITLLGKIPEVGFSKSIGFWNLLPNRLLEMLYKFSFTPEVYDFSNTLVFVEIHTFIMWIFFSYEIKTKHISLYELVVSWKCFALFFFCYNRQTFLAFHSFYCFILNYKIFKLEYLIYSSTLLRRRKPGRSLLLEVPG